MGMTVNAAVKKAMPIAPRWIRNQLGPRMAATAASIAGAVQGLAKFHVQPKNHRFRTITRGSSRQA